jgi:hypothetical protein
MATALVRVTAPSIPGDIGLPAFVLIQGRA